MKEENKYWEELISALEGNFSTDKKREVKIHIFKRYSNKEDATYNPPRKKDFKEVGILFGGGVKNTYEVPGFEREAGDEWRWELFLHKDGTWSIK